MRSGRRGPIDPGTGVVPALMCNDERPRSELEGEVAVTHWADTANLRREAFSAPGFFGECLKGAGRSLAKRPGQSALGVCRKYVADLEASGANSKRVGNDE